MKGAEVRWNRCDPCPRTPRDYCWDRQGEGVVEEDGAAPSQPSHYAPAHNPHTRRTHAANAKPGQMITIGSSFHLGWSALSSAIPARE